MDFKVDAAGLTGAAGQYTQAAEAYDTALGKLEQFFSSVGEGWKDAAGATWAEVTAGVKPDLQKVSQSLNGNAAFLTAAAGKAEEITATMQGEVSKLYG